MGADHLSLYELTIEPGAAFAFAVKRKDWTPLDDDRSAGLYEVTQAMTAAAGFDGYRDLQSRARGRAPMRAHRIYWSSGDWVGVGAGEHGRLTMADAAGGDERWAIEAAEKPGDYLRQVTTQGLGWVGVEKLAAVADARERVAMGLRVVEGFERGLIDELGLSLDEARVAELVRDGLLVDGARVALTPEGRLLADRITGEIAP